MTNAEVPTLDTSNIPDLPYRLTVDEISPDCWEITAEEDDKIARAARPNLVTRALAGDAEAMAELRQLGLTLWQHEREEQP